MNKNFHTFVSFSFLNLPSFFIKKMKKIVKEKATVRKVSNIFEKTGVCGTQLKKLAREKTSEQRVIKSSVAKKKYKVGK